MLTQTEAAPPEVNLKQMPCEMDEGIGTRANIGLVVLSSDQTIEYEYRLLLNLPGVAVYQSRIANDNVITPASLRAMEGRIQDAAELLIPGIPMQVVGYGCTSASMLIGEDRVLDLLKAAHPEARYTTPITAARAAFSRLGMQRIALLTPYADEVNNQVRAYIEEQGIDVPVMGSFTVNDDRQSCRITPASIRDAAIEIGRQGHVDGVFVSCTALRVAEVIQDIEDTLGKPVTASNHAMAWHSLRLAGIEDTRQGFGRLFTL